MTSFSGYLPASFRRVSAGAGVAFSAVFLLPVGEAPASAVTPTAPPPTASLEVVGLQGSDSTPFVRSGTTGYRAVPRATAGPDALSTLTTHGCSEDSTAVALSPDKMAVTVTHSDLVARIGPNVRAADATVVCDVKVVLRIPQGYTYAISKVDFRGYAKLAAGVSAFQVYAYRFVGHEGAGNLTLLTGAMNDDWIATEKAADPVYAPCQEAPTLDLQTVLHLEASTSPQSTLSYITMDAADAEFASVYHVTWATCD